MKERLAPRLTERDAYCHYRLCGGQVGGVVHAKDEMRLDLGLFLFKSA